MSDYAAVPLPQRLGQWFTELLDRPEVILSAVPVGALYVGLMDLIMSKGMRPGGGAIGWAVVGAFYLVQCLLVLFRPGWTESGRAAVVIALSPMASLLFQQFLVAPPAPAVWCWLCGPVLMMAGYLCRPWQAVGVAVVTLACQTVFFAASGALTAANTGLVLLSLVLSLLPGALAVQVLGSLHSMERMVQDQSWRDPLTSVLNRHGLEQEFDALVGVLGPGAQMSVLAVDIDDFKTINDSLGHSVGDQTLVAVAQALTRAYRRDHLVGRIGAEGFVLVTQHDPAHLAASVLQAVRDCLPDRPVTASIGIIRGIPRGAINQGQLGGAVVLAERAARRARDEGRDRYVVDDFDEDEPLAGPTRSVPTGDEQMPVARRDESRLVADSRILGVALAATALLTSLVPVQHDNPVRSWGTLVACQVLVGIGAWMALSPRALPRVGLPALVLATVASETAVSQAVTPLAKLAALSLVCYPMLAGALLLESAPAAGLCVLVLVSVPMALRTGVQVPSADQLMTVMTGLMLITASLALWTRRQRDIAAAELLRLSLLDPLTGLATRRGLLARYRRFEPGDELDTVFLDVNDLKTVNVSLGHQVGDSALRQIATVLTELAGRHGTAARVGGDEFVLLMPGPARTASIRRSLDLRLAVADPPLSVSTGVAHGVRDGDGNLWRMMSMADEALLRARAEERQETPAR